MALAGGGVFAQTLTIYTEDAPPYNFIGKDGKTTGLTYEVVMEIQKRIKNTDPIQVVPWARGVNELDTKPNVLLFSMARSGERNPKYQWIGPVAEMTFAFYSKASSKVTVSSLEDAKKVNYVGVYLNDIRDQILTGQGFKNLDKSNDTVTPIKKLMGDRLDLVASSPDEIGLLLKEAGYKVTDVKFQFVFQRIQLYITASKATPPTVVKTWNDALDAMKKDGSYERIFKKYLPDSPLPAPAITTF